MTSRQGRGSRLGPLARDRGNTSFEVVGGLMAVSMTAVLMFQFMAIVVCEFNLSAGSRTAARAASIAPDRAAATSEVRKIAARLGASSSMSDDASYVTVTFTRPMSVLFVDRALTVSAHSAALKESAW